MTYAANTSVPVERSKTEIEGILTRYGASKFGYVTEATQAAIAFNMKGRAIRMMLPLPSPADFARTEKGRTRPAGQRDDECAKAIRSRWRSLLLIVKAKLEAEASGITTFEEEWLPYTLVPGTGQTVSERIGQDLTIAYEKGGTPRLAIGMDP